MAMNSLERPVDTTSWTSWTSREQFIALVGPRLKIDPMPRRRKTNRPTQLRTNLQCCVDRVLMSPNANSVPIASSYLLSRSERDKLEGSDAINRGVSRAARRTGGVLRA